MKNKNKTTIKKTISLIFTALVLTLVTVSCSTEQFSRQEGVALYKGQDILLSEIAEMDTPRGILPASLGYSDATGNITNVTETTTYKEFFVFDKEVSLIVLSTYPMYFIKIESEDFYYHLNNECEQIKAGKRGTDKDPQSTSFYKEVGNYSIEIYFSPEEIKYNNSEGGDNEYRICILNDNLRQDPWRFINAAKKNTMYVPTLEQTKIYEDLNYGSYKNGQSNAVFTKASSLTNVNPVNYTIVDTNIEFSFFLGEDLEMTDNLTPPPYPGPVVMDDESELTRDFALFFSLPIGDSMDSTKDYLNDNDGISVIIRGDDLSRIKTFLEYEGVSHSKKSAANPWLLLEDSGSYTLDIKWFVEKDIKLYYAKESSTYGDPEAYGDPVTQGTMSSYSLPIDRGCKYFVKLTDSDDNLIGEESILLPTNELAITEVMYMGTTVDSSDEWFEIKNISARKIDLSTVEFWYENSDNNREDLAQKFALSAASFELLPGEYMVMAKFEAGGSDATIFDILDTSGIKIKYNNALSLNSNYTLELRDTSGKVITTVYEQKGGKSRDYDYNISLYKSTILNISGEWETSGNGSGVSINVCSPGFAAEGEF
ncbi:MAG: lamin tail domain-containing protein [bacterium]|nr:lamin tail domain-containing protein [bacterium]